MKEETLYRIPKGMKLSEITELTDGELKTMNWIDIKTEIPKTGGMYRVKTNDIEMTAFWTKTFKGKWFFMLPNESIKVTHWIKK